MVLHHYYSPWLPGGGIGVSLFFALSGYLICSLILQPAEFTYRRAASFVVRRFFRVYPPYAAVIVLTLFVASWAEDARLPGLLSAAPGLLTFTRMPSDWLGYAFGILWTLQVEFYFYISLPLITLAVGRGRPLLFACVALVVVGLSFKAFHLTQGRSPVTSIIIFLTWVDCLALGAIVAWLLKAGIRLGQTASRRILFAGTLSYAALCVVPSTQPIVWYGQSIVTACVGSALILALASHPPRQSLPVLGVIGLISYSIYLLHGPMLDFARPSTVLGLTISLLTLSAISYLTIEKPSMNMGRWLGRMLSDKTK